MSSPMFLGTIRYSSRAIRPRCAAAASALASPINVTSNDGNARHLFTSSIAKANETRKPVVSIPSWNFPLRSFSTSSADEKGGVVGGLFKNVSSPMQWWRNRQESQQAEMYKKRVDFMVNKPDWTLNDMMQELDEVLSSWTSKIPGVSNNKEITMAKQMHKTISSITAVVGANATIEDLDNMTRAEKLQAAVQSEQAVQDINLFIQQFSTACLMHRVLRKRKLEGKRIPETPEAIQEVIQTEGKSVLTRAQKEKLKRQAHKAMRKSMR